MELNENDILLIERYLAGELSKREREDFQARLQADAELAAYVAAHQQADAALVRQHRKKRFARYDRELERSHTVSLMVRYAAAAAMVLAAGIVGYRKWNEEQKQAPIAKVETSVRELLQIRGQIIELRPDTGMGFAGTDSVQQTVPVWLTAAPAHLPVSYLFRDTLQIFIPLADAAQIKDTVFQRSLGLSLTYDRTRNDTYFLTFRGKTYALKRYGRQPEPLQ